MTYFELKISIKWANYAFIHSFQVIFAHSSTERNQYNIPVNVPVFESKHNLDWNITSTMRIIQKVPITPGTTAVQEAIQFSLSLLEWVEWLNPCLNQSDLMIPFIHDLQTSLVISQPFTECLGFTERYQHHWFLRVVRNGLTRP